MIWKSEWTGRVYRIDSDGIFWSVDGKQEWQCDRVVKPTWSTERCIRENKRVYPRGTGFKDEFNAL